MANPTIRIPLAAALSTLAIAEAVALAAFHILPVPADLFLRLMVDENQVCKTVRPIPTAQLSRFALIRDLRDKPA